MDNILSTAASRGHVRAVFSGRCKGFAAPLALIEANLRAVVRSILATRKAENEKAIDSARDDLRARLAAEMAGYLVTEPDCEPVFSESRSFYDGGMYPQFVTAGRQWPLGCAWRDLAGGPLDSPDVFPAGACVANKGDALWAPSQLVAHRRDALEPADSARPFSKHRAWYQSGSGVERCCVTGGKLRLGLELGFCQGDLDAPDFLPAGACDELGAMFGECSQVVVPRGMDEPAFTARREYWRRWSESLGLARTGPVGGLNLASHMRASFSVGGEVGSLDAPEFLPAGACRWVEFDFGAYGFPSLRLVDRRNLGQ